MEQYKNQAIYGSCHLGQVRVEGSNPISAALAAVLSKPVLWKCCVCGKSSKKSSQIISHIEAKHLCFPGFDCNQCGKLYKTRDSLRHHNAD